MNFYAYINYFYAYEILYALPCDPRFKNKINYHQRGFQTFVSERFIRFFGLKKVTNGGKMAKTLMKRSKTFLQTVSGCNAERSSRGAVQVQFNASKTKDTL